MDKLPPSSSYESAQEFCKQCTAGYISKVTIVVVSQHLDCSQCCSKHSTITMIMMISEGKNSTSHYAICTGIMAMGMMVPGMFSGIIQESFGYFNFFIWVILSTIPGLIMIKFLSIKQNYGRNKA